MIHAERISRREYIGKLLQIGGVLLIGGNTFITAESKSLNFERTLIMSKQTIKESVTQYVTAWNISGAEKIKTALGKCWTADSTYADPNNAPVKGQDGLTKLIEFAQKQTPGGQFSQMSEPEFHHGSGCFKWRLTKKDGSARDGLDYFEYDSENRITRIVGFFEILG